MLGTKEFLGDDLTKGTKGRRAIIQVKEERMDNALYSEENFSQIAMAKRW